MSSAKLSEPDFIAMFESLGPSAMARQIGSDPSVILGRRRRIEKNRGIAIRTPESNYERPQTEEIPGRLALEVKNGTVFVGSDLHAWPGEPSTAFKAFLKLIKDLKPQAVIMNGDVIDGASISRHPPLGWEKRPALIDEIEAAQTALMKVEQAAGRGTPLYWPAGNHDARFGTRLATVAPEYAKIHGTKLKDHFGERWQPCWSTWINDDVVVKHRARGGIHASYNSTLHAGRTLVHGHLHSLKVTPFTDYRGRRYGVDCGMLADSYGPQFGYLEDSVRSWCSGFAILTFHEGELLFPEVCAVLKPGVAEFRGKVLHV